MSVCFSYALSDSLANIFDFELTPMHMPTRSSAPAFTIVAAPALDYNYMGKRGNSNPNQSTWRNQESSGSYGARNQENNGPYGARDYREKQVSTVCIPGNTDISFLIFAGMYILRQISNQLKCY